MEDWQTKSSRLIDELYDLVVVQEQFGGATKERVEELVALHKQQPENRSNRLYREYQWELGEIENNPDLTEKEKDREKYEAYNNYCVASQGR